MTKKRSATTGRGDIRRLVKSLSKLGVSRGAIDTLIGIRDAELEALTEIARGLVQSQGTKTISIEVVRAAVKMRYPDPATQAKTLEAGDAAVRRYLSSSA